MEEDASGGPPATDTARHQDGTDQCDDDHLQAVNSDFASPRIPEDANQMTERAEEDDDDEDVDLEELIIIDDAEQELRENELAGNEDAEMIKEQQMQEQAIEQ